MAKNTNRPKVLVVTLLFVMAAVIFSLIAAQGIWKINQYDKNFRPVSDSPGLCYDEKDGGSVRDNSYPCYTYTDMTGKNAEVDDDNDRTIFLYDKYVFLGKTQTMQMRSIVVVISALFAATAIFGAVIYYIHNS